MSYKQDLEDFKILVVKVAMRDAARNHWCRQVVKSLIEMGLGDYIGTIFIYQQRRQSGGHWAGSDCYYTLAAANRQMNSARRTGNSHYEHRLVTVNPYTWRVEQVLDHYKPSQDPT